MKKSLKKVTLNRKKDKNNQKNFKTAQIFADYAEDMYLNRRQIYRINFVKGFYFGIGRTIGSVLIMVIIIWAAVMMIDWPVLGKFIKETFEYFKEIR